MERILRSQEMAEIILLPVRHHSPACARHVARMIREIRPAAILVEGPENACPLIPVMVHGDTKAPFAVYYSYHDASGRISEEKAHYKCYYPFLDYSPELAALREGAGLGIETAFIDLPYGDILAASGKGEGLLEASEEKKNYNDDYLLSRNEYLKRLCEKTGLRGFDEFWEKYFELEGVREDGAKWFGDLLAYCALARENTPLEELRRDGCLARERFMARRIRERARQAASGKGTVLVVTGGFHTPGLKALLESVGEEGAETVNGRAEAGCQGVYLMPYSMEAADALNGYASGMPFAGFYQKAWEGMEESDTPYRDAVLDMIVASGKETRRQEGNPSTYDEICACAMAGGLAELRGKREPGAYELLDAVLSSFVKGEYTMATDTPMRNLRRCMTGQAVGTLCRQADMPPIIHDFEAQCGRFGLKAKSTLETEAVLNIFSNKKHRQESRFFHRMAFLKTGFSVRKKGPDLRFGKDRNLIRETWVYKWNAQVGAALIDVSVYGGTIEEGAVGLVREELKKDLDARESAGLLTRVFEMGLEEQMRAVYERVYELMRRDGDFYSVADAVKSLMAMEELGNLYGNLTESGGLLHLGCRRLIALLPSMVGIKDGDLNRCMDVLKLLYLLTGRDAGGFGQEREAYYAALFGMGGDGRIHPGLNGCLHGILYGGGRETAEEVEAVCRGYLGGTVGQLSSTAQFFRGLFYAARDLVFIGGRFTEMLDEFLGKVSRDEFMGLLPELRMAFTYFTPRETDKIASMAAGLHGRGRDRLLGRREVFPEWYSYGKEMDGYVRSRMGKKPEYAGTTEERRKGHGG